MYNVKVGDNVRLTNRSDGQILYGRIIQLSFTTGPEGRHQFLVKLDNGGTLHIEGPVNTELPWQIEKVQPDPVLPTKHGAVVVNAKYPGYYSYYLHIGSGGIPYWWRVGALDSEPVKPEDVVKALRVSGYIIAFEGIDRS